MKGLLEFRRNASQEFRSSGEKYPSSSRDLLFPLLLFVPLFIFGRRPYRVVSRSPREGRCDRDRARRRWSATRVPGGRDDLGDGARRPPFLGKIVVAVELDAAAGCGHDVSIAAHQHQLLRSRARGWPFWFLPVTLGSRLRGRVVGIEETGAIPR